MDKSITQSNEICGSYLTGLFSFVSSTIGYPKLCVMYLCRSEILNNVTVPSGLGNLVLVIAWQNGHQYAMISYHE